MSDHTIDPRQLMELDDDAEAALLMGGEAATSGDSSAPGQTPQGGRPGATEAPGQQHAARGDQGDPNVPLSHARQRARELELALAAEQEQRAALAGLLQNPQALQAYLAQLQGQQPGQGQVAPEPEAPRLALEDPRAVEAIVRQVQEETIGRFLPVMQTLEERLYMEGQHRELGALAAEFGEEAVQLVQEFDTEVPEFAEQGLPLRARYFMAHGISSRNPAAQAAQAQQAAGSARQMAAAAVADGLKTIQGQPTAPSLGAVPPAAPNGQPVDAGGINFAQFQSLSGDAEEALLQGRLFG